MDRLFDGVLRFKRHEYERHEARFRGLGRRQNPHTLFIGCADSRIVPNLITSTLPGELFTVRNIANIVPPYRLTGEYVSTTSAVEYALGVLKIENIVVCGHSNCGGCGALWDEETLREAPHTRRWLELAARARERVLAHARGRPLPEGERALLTERYNVLEQLRHLLTYPGVKERFRARSLKVFGWHYEIDSGEVSAYDPGEKAFVKIG
ncbi:MAG: carbonic anhydrase [Spirochaetales bacterium]|nr:carbonic anhydrase [Spirochaetales bacterium]